MFEVIDREWVDILDKTPSEEGYHEVKFADGSTDSKPFRIRLRQNIFGFMTENTVTHWRQELPDADALPVD